MQHLYARVGGPVATALGESEEVRQYIKEAPFALDRLLGNVWVNAKYGLPDRMYGMDLKVDECYQGLFVLFCYNGKPLKELPAHPTSSPDGLGDCDKPLIVDAA